MRRPKRATLPRRPGRCRATVVPILPSPRASSRACRARVQGEQDVGAVGDEQPAVGAHARPRRAGRARRGRRRGCDHHAVAQDAAHAGVQDARRDQLQREVAVAESDGVAGVVAALVAHHAVEGRAEQIDDLPLALVPPLHADDDDAVHGLLSSTARHGDKVPHRFRAQRGLRVGQQRTARIAGDGNAPSAPPSCCCRWPTCCWRSTTASSSSPVAALVAGGGLGRAQGGPGPPPRLPRAG